jgi:hypothetical protein
MTSTPAIYDAPIVVGVDGSEHADRALNWAVREAQLRHAPLDIISATCAPQRTALGFGQPPVCQPRLRSGGRGPGQLRRGGAFGFGIHERLDRAAVVVAGGRPPIRAVTPRGSASSG